jgi:hypothetical protein
MAAAPRGAALRSGPTGLFARGYLFGAQSLLLGILFNQIKASQDLPSPEVVPLSLEPLHNHISSHPLI